MKNIYQKILIFLLFANIAKAQIAGIVSDASTQERLVGAAIIIKGTNIGVSTNANGYFKFEGAFDYPITLEVQYIGYQKLTHTISSPNNNVKLNLTPNNLSLSEVVISARREGERAMDLAIPIAVLGGGLLEQAAAFNVNTVKEMIPSVQLYSSNPRNTTLNIRGIGSTFGLTNDGIDPGVGFYVDGVYFARPAATTIDFIDISQLEVLRGPQGTLFGKNTTAGALNIVTRRPTFENNLVLENTFGNFGFVQSRGSFSGAIIKNKLAGRLSFSATNRDGVLHNISTQKNENTLNNLGFRGQLLYKVNDSIEILIIGDNSVQSPSGFAQVYAGEVVTKRANFRQFSQIIKDLNYELPSRNPFDRIIDHDTPWRSNQQLGGASVQADVKKKLYKFTSISAWRYWNWDPSNDRDFTGLEGLRRSKAPSRQDQFSQEFRFDFDVSKKVKALFGVFGFYQTLNPNGAHIEEAGKDQWRFSQTSNNPIWATPGLIEGFGVKTMPNFRNLSAAIFSQFDYKVNQRLTLNPGLRLNYDQKSVDFRRETFGGLQTTDPALIALKNSVYTNQAFERNISNTNLSGQLFGTYKASANTNVFAGVSLGFKPVGLNLGGLPTENGRVMVELADIKPERITHFEMGVKSQPFNNAILNVSLFKSIIKDFQALVQSPDLAINRGFLSNAEQVSVTGLEMEFNYNWNSKIEFTSNLSYTDGRYDKFTNAPVPLEETGGPSFKDISGGVLPGISKWATTNKLQFNKRGSLFAKKGEFYFAVELFYRSGFSSSPSPSAHLNIPAYALTSLRTGFRVTQGVSINIWARNLFNTNYFELLLPGAGNAGHFAGVLGDPRMYGITLKYTLN